MMTNDTDKSVPKIVDFGLAKIIGPGELTKEPYGTVGYCSPEVLKGQPYSHSCDIWSLGCVIYAMLTGYLPFDHNEQSVTIKMTLKE